MEALLPSVGEAQGALLRTHAAAGLWQLASLHKQAHRQARRLEQCSTQEMLLRWAKAVGASSPALPVVGCGSIPAGTPDHTPARTCIRVKTCLLSQSLPHQPPAACSATQRQWLQAAASHTGACDSQLPLLLCARWCAQGSQHHRLPAQGRTKEVAAASPAPGRATQCCQVPAGTRLQCVVPVPWGRGTAQCRCLTGTRCSQEGTPQPVPMEWPAAPAAPAQELPDCTRNIARQARLHTA